VWDLTTGEARRTWRPHKAPVADVAIDASGGYVATASADRGVKVWDLDKGCALTHSFSGHGGVVLRVLFHPKQLLLVSAGADCEVRVWDLVDRSCVHVFKGHYSAVTSVAFSPAGWHLLSGARDRVVNVWDLRSGAKAATVPVYESVEGERGRRRRRGCFFV
jgi:U3 small nucleolar RNA-associated protein 13